jgi:hypothetical protein
LTGERLADFRAPPVSEAGIERTEKFMRPE